ncbi:hypothetical protein BRADI_4g09648v3 [Brachypodium distachyon]|uniref:DDE Tnp4 domain-containing protein n=1 Tax=Brachypodium distachyon TaxID=15368 RepID=A0A2K2CLL9_BRADI|nr:hypothetical protein BRADI_4g09648v3 [Brachypodium distachyon]
MEEDTRALVKILLSEKEGYNKIMVVAIVGVGGIGKTTLAKKVFNDEAINAKFDKVIWLSINQYFDKVELLRTAVTLAGGDQHSENALAVLQPALTAALTGKKLLLVMDDVWSHTAWGDVFETTLASAAAQGSRILVTTRDERVARGMKGLRPYHRVDTLNDEDAWSLLKKQVVSSIKDGNEIDMLKDIGLQIVAKCGGLPLAVKVMGGLLCQKNRERSEWEMVVNDSIWSVSEMPEELNYAIYISYEDLPPSIKQCFLYYSLLPKNAVFLKSCIIGMWISEGFLHEISDDLEELGSKYYKELILRNLIQPKIEYIDQNFCTMHDVVRAFAQFVAREEALPAHSGQTGIISKLSARKFVRLSLESELSESHELDWSSFKAQKTLRTLISVGNINTKPRDSSVDFPCLRTLHTDSTNVALLVKSLDELKHLRYLSIERSDISSLPDNIGNMKFLQYISVEGCKQFVKVPRSIVKLGKLRCLIFRETSISWIPRGFCALTNLRALHGFPALVNGDWSSLEELGSLSLLRALGLKVLENVSAAATSSATKVRLAEKVHLTYLSLSCSSRLGDDGLIKAGEAVSEEDQRQIEEVFDELCSPPTLDRLEIVGYFGQRLPRWMMSASASCLKSLRILMMKDLACCTEMPDGLSQLPCLQFIQILRAPSIKRVGPEFWRPCCHLSPRASQAAVVFPRLHRMELLGMVEWEEWEWEEQVQAFPVLEELLLDNCKLRRLPPGLAFQGKALKQLHMQHVHQLNFLENLVSVVDLQVHQSPDLERITNLPKLQKLVIVECPKLKVLKGVCALQRLVLEDYGMETLPEYMRGINLSHFQLDSSLALLISIATGQPGPEWDKFSHVQNVKAYANGGPNNPRKWHVLYTKDPYNLETNINLSFMCTGTLSLFKDAQRFESVLKMTRRTFSYICSLVKVQSLEDMNSYTFTDGRVLCLEDRVAIALIMLNSGEPLEAVALSVGVNESTISLVTERFIDATWEQADHHLNWPGSSEIEKVKSMFDKIHGLPNCCGIICTTHIIFGSQNCNNETNDDIIVQVVVDPDMRFNNIWLGGSDAMNQMSLLHDSQFFKECDAGALVNGSKLELSSNGSEEVEEYVIGAAGYPLRPWLLTPYKQQNMDELLDSQVEFNRRHSAALTFVLKVLARLKDTWKCLHGGMWHPEDPKELSRVIYVCITLHNIVIDMEEAPMVRPLVVNYSKRVRRLADEDAVSVRDLLSQHFIGRSSQSQGTLYLFEDSQMFESVLKMTRRTFSYICSLVKVPSLKDMNNYTFIDGRVLCLEDRVAVALIMLNAGQTLDDVGSSVGVNKSTVSLVTERFVDAMRERARHHMKWPGSGEMENVKSKFDKILGLPNCCGVVHTSHIPFGSENCDHERNFCVLMQAVVDPDMRFRNIWQGWSDRTNQLGLLHNSELFKECENGAWLNGSKLEVSSEGSEVGEYVIGDAGYPLLPWLLTPYQQKDTDDQLDSQVEFNRRHSVAVSFALKALARLTDTWKCLHRGSPKIPCEMWKAIQACCMLHNIVIDMEEAPMARDYKVNYSEQVRGISEEDAARARDLLSENFIRRSSESQGLSANPSGSGIEISGDQQDS